MSNEISVDDLRKFAEKFVANEPERLGGTNGWWQTPLLTAAPIDAGLINCRRLRQMIIFIRGIFWRQPNR